MHRKRPLLAFVVTLVSAAAAGLPAAAAEPSPASSRAAAKTVILRGFEFSPERVTVSRGGTVRWVWRDGRIRHNVTFAGRRRGTSKATGSFTRTFTRSGRFAYRCTLHPGMAGAVVVR